MIRIGCGATLYSIIVTRTPLKKKKKTSYSIITAPIVSFAT